MRELGKVRRGTLRPAKSHFLARSVVLSPIALARLPKDAPPVIPTFERAAEKRTDKSVESFVSLARELFYRARGNRLSQRHLILLSRARPCLSCPLETSRLRFFFLLFVVFFFFFFFFFSLFPFLRTLPFLFSRLYLSSLFVQERNDASVLGIHMEGIRLSSEAAATAGSDGGCGGAATEAVAVAARDEDATADTRGVRKEVPALTE